MHLPTTILAVLAALAPSIHAKSAWPPNLNGADLTKIEACAIHCLADGFHDSQCRDEDLRCLCNSQPFVDKVKHCAKRGCRPHH
ncbi:hypothetical protein DL546_006225 [Coniochaeta pulveracea]|uniref:CFEM domain-containing protein n=1 Tax=Coniochaeta pulveracea TaxID=177199 RepID=A0A420Y3T7_9PEZI|nr:hypothetical protein DL546_006225 [Coniochaeta pulveracea]